MHLNAFCVSNTCSDISRPMFAFKEENLQVISSIHSSSQFSRRNKKKQYKKIKFSIKFCTLVRKLNIEKWWVEFRTRISSSRNYFLSKFLDTEWKILSSDLLCGGTDRPGQRDRVAFFIVKLLCRSICIDVEEGPRKLEKHRKRNRKG